MNNLEKFEDLHKEFFTGNILLFYVFDIGDDIDIEVIKHKGLLQPCTIPLSSYFKNYHLPFSFRLHGQQDDVHDYGVQDASCLSSKLHHFGALSFCYRIPFENSFEDLKLKVINTKKVFDERSDIDAKNVFKKIINAVKKPRFYNLKNSYFAVQVHPIKDTLTPETFKERYGSKIASLLKLEIYNLSEYQKDEILNSTIGYYGQDLIIIDSEGSFIYDDEYFEPLEFFEFANIQKLELQYFDRLLDQKLNFFYHQEAFKVPFSAYLPLWHRYIDLPVLKLTKLRVDISVITERLENSIKLAGDAYYSKLYSMLNEKLSLKEWRDSIGRKLDIIRDLYTVYQDRVDTIHEEMLTVVIILLIMLEASLVFLR